MPKPPKPIFHHNFYCRCNPNSLIISFLTVLSHLVSPHTQRNILITGTLNLFLCWFFKKHIIIKDKVLNTKESRWHHEINPYRRRSNFPWRCKTRNHNYFPSLIKENISGFKGTSTTVVKTKNKNEKSTSNVTSFRARLRNAV